MEIIVINARKSLSDLWDYLKKIKCVSQDPKVALVLKKYKISRLGNIKMKTLLELLNAAQGTPIFVSTNVDLVKWEANLENIFDRRLLKRLYPHRFNGNDAIPCVKRKHDDLVFRLNTSDKVRRSVRISHTRWNEALRKNETPQPHRTTFTLKRLIEILELADMRLKFVLPEIPVMTSQDMMTTHKVLDDSTPVLVGFYASREQLNLILHQRIYHFRQKGYRRVQAACNGNWPTIALILPISGLHSFNEQDDTAPHFCFELDGNEPEVISCKTLHDEYKYESSPKDQSDRWMVRITAISTSLSNINDSSIYDRVHSDYQARIWTVAYLESKGMARRADIPQLQAAEEGSDVTE